MSAPPKLSFSLGSGASKKPGPPAPPAGFGVSIAPKSQAQTKAGPSRTGKVPGRAGGLGFGDDDDDDEEAGDGLLLSGRAGPSTGVARPKASHKASLLNQPKISRAARKLQEDAQKVDASVFDYDAVFDGMKEAQRAVERRREEEAQERKVGGGVVMYGRAEG